MKTVQLERYRSRASLVPIRAQVGILGIPIVAVEHAA